MGKKIRTKKSAVVAADEILTQLAAEDENNKRAAASNVVSLKPVKPIASQAPKAPKEREDFVAARKLIAKIQTLQKEAAALPLEEQKKYRLQGEEYIEAVGLVISFLDEREKLLEQLETEKERYRQKGLFMPESRETELNEQVVKLEALVQDLRRDGNVEWGAKIKMYIEDIEFANSLPEMGRLLEKGVQEGFYEKIIMEQGKKIRAEEEEPGWFGVMFWRGSAYRPWNYDKVEAVRAVVGKMSDLRERAEETKKEYLAEQIKVLQEVPAPNRQLFDPETEDLGTHSVVISDFRYRHPASKKEESLGGIVILKVTLAKYQGTKDVWKALRIEKAYGSIGWYVRPVVGKPYNLAESEPKSELWRVRNIIGFLLRQTEEKLRDARERYLNDLKFQQKEDARRARKPRRRTARRKGIVEEVEPATEAKSA